MPIRARMPIFPRVFGKRFVNTTALSRHRPAARAGDDRSVGNEAQPTMEPIMDEEHGKDVLDKAKGAVKDAAGS